jgi:hypothetical protein
VIERDRNEIARNRKRKLLLAANFAKKANQENSCSFALISAALGNSPLMSLRAAERSHW